MPAILFTLNDEYPLVKQQYLFKFSGKYFLIGRSMNGAPELEEMDNDDPKSKEIVFGIEDGNREEIEPGQWVYRYCSYPSIKFQVVYSPPRFAKNSNYFLGEINELNTDVTEEEVKKVLPEIFFDNRYHGSSGYTSLKGDIKKMHGYNGDDKEFVEFVYNIVRHHYYFNKLAYYGVDYDLYFTAFMSRALEEKGIDHRLVICVPRHFGKLDDLILKDEMYYLLQADIDGEEMIIFPFGRHRMFGEHDYRLEGVDAYVIELTKKDRYMDAERIKLPISEYSENVLSTSYDISIQEDMSTLDINRKTGISGLMKSFYSSDILINPDFLDEEHEEYNTTQEPQTRNKVILAENERKKEAKQDELREKRIERMEEEVEDEFNLVEYISFDLESDGRYSESKDLVYSETFQIDDVIKRAGKNYIIEIGKMIGNQIELDENDMEREVDVYMPFARCYKNQITMTIPDGYVVEGVENLNMKVETEAGGFISNATIEGNKLTFTTDKYYTNNYFSVEKWPEMVEFLEAAYQFTQQKVLLKKE